MSDELSHSPEQTTAKDAPVSVEQDDGNANDVSAQATPAEPEVAPIPAAQPAATDEAVEDKAAGTEADAVAGAHTEAEAATKAATEAAVEAANAEAEQSGLPKGSIAAVGERLGQRVAQVSEAAGDKVAHAGEVAAARVAQVGGAAGEKVAHAGEAAGQRVILAVEAAEGTVTDAQTRAAQAKQRISQQAGQLASRIRHSTPPPVREKGARAVDAVKKHPRETAVGSALVGLVAVIRRRGKRSGSGE